jgi:dienelactone hydrolase
MKRVAALIVLLAAAPCLFAAELVLPKTAAKKAPLVVFVHWGLGDHNAFRDDAKTLSRLGVASLLVDAPFTRPGAKEDEDEDLRQCVREVRAELDRLTKRKDIDAARIGFVGLSYGAHVGALLVQAETRIRTYVLMGGLASNNDEKIAELDAERFVKQPHKAPIFFQFARKDEYIDYAQATRFVDAASPPKVAKWYEGGHQFNESARRDRFGWLAAMLRFPLPDANYFAVAPSEAPASELGRYAELSMFGVVIEMPGMQQIRVRRGIAWKGALKFDVYYPFGMEDEPKLRLPAVVLVSGQAGPQLMQHLRGVAFNTTLARALTARANRIVVVPDIGPTYTSLEDPKQENSRLADVAGDLRDLFTYLRAHGEELQIDGESLAVVARSAGWSYGLNAALHGSPDFIKAVVLHYGQLSVEPLRGTGIRDELLPQFSPVELLKESKAFPPFLLVTAGHDFFYAAADVNAFLDAAKAKSAPVTHIHLADGEHGFDTVNDYEDSRDALLRTFMFLRQHLPIRRTAAP